MRIAILGGGGAMGGLFGGYLVRSGNEVTLIDVSKAAVDAVNAAGLSVEERDGTVWNVGIPASSDPAAVGPVELIINFVKSYHTEAAIRAALPMMDEDTVILTLQNGWGNAPRIASIVGDDKVLVGLTYHSGTLVGPGKVKHPNSGVTIVGELGGDTTPRVERIAAALVAAGIETSVSTRIVDEVWKKLALNCCTLPTSGVLGVFAHELVAHDGAENLMAGILDEVAAVARAKGIVFDRDERWTAITGLLTRAIGAKASMLQDVEARRQTEIDVVNGAIVEAGKETGIATPYNQAMVWLMQTVQGRYLQAEA